MKNDRKYDVIVWGATGFTGTLVAEYLAETAQGLRWAIGGRNREKLENVRRSLPTKAEIDIVVGDSLEAAFVDTLAASTKVVCSTVGPYSRYGTPLVEACAKNGTSYCDLTAEVQWVRANIDAFHDTAKQSGARIVHSCGFDSIPSDLGVLKLYRHISTTPGATLEDVKLYLEEMSGGVSGGTMASMMTVLDAAKDPAQRRILLDPNSLSPGREQTDERDQREPRFDQKRQRWTAPFFMAAVNTRTVRRSHALLGFKYGPKFRYAEAADTGPGPLGAIKAGALTAGLGVLFGASMNPFLRKTLEKLVLPEPGEGPSREKRESGSFTMLLAATTRGFAAPEVECLVRGQRDPGYGATSRMLGECAMCLAQDELSSEGGILTPARAMGDALYPRLEKAGVTFTIGRAEQPLIAPDLAASRSPSSEHFVR